MAVDIENHLDVFSMSVEKSGVHMVADLVQAVEHAVSEDGTTFADYLADAEEAFRAIEPSRSQTQSDPSARTGHRTEGEEGNLSRDGLHRGRGATTDSVEANPGWRLRRGRPPGTDTLAQQRLPGGDSEGHARRRQRRSALEGTPLPPLRRHLPGVAFGPKDKDNVSLWLDVLTAAAEEEQRDYYG